MSSTIGTISSGFLRCCWAWLRCDRRPGVEQPHLQRLVAAAALGDAELDASAVA